MRFAHKRTAPPGSAEAPSEFIAQQADERRQPNLPTSAAPPSKRIGRPPRPKPVGFELAFVTLGEELLTEHFRAGKRAVSRWLAESGRDELRVLRRNFVARERELRRRRNQRPQTLGRGAV